MTNEPKLWIVISRSDRLPNALVAADALRERFSGGIHLLREESKWWKNAKWQEFVGEFAEVHAFPKIRTCRGLKDLVASRSGKGCLALSRRPARIG